MTSKQLAHELMLGFRTALTCQDVNPREYECVMAMQLAASRRDAFLTGATAYATALGHSGLMSENPILAKCREQAEASLETEVFPSTHEPQPKQVK